MKSQVITSLVVVVLCCAGQLPAQSIKYSSDAPRPTPVMRPQMKQMIEDVKIREPRIPLPELTKQARSDLGDRADSYETRVKYHYLGEVPAADRRRANGIDPDYQFHVELFWIVSRANNCQYCIGHQESKLLASGLQEDQIAALDCDWRAFSPAEQCAFEFARKLTLEPHLLEAADIQRLLSFFDEKQVAAMLVSVSWNNSINRWKEAVGVPQHAEEGGYSRASDLPTHELESLKRQGKWGTYLTPTSEKYASRMSQVVMLDHTGQASMGFSDTKSHRPPLEPSSFAFQQVRDVSARMAALPLATPAQAQDFFGEPSGRFTHWERLLAVSGESGRRRAVAVREALTQSLANDQRLRAQIWWIVARHDRAWYSLAHAAQQLQRLGLDEEEMVSLDGDWAAYSDRERALFTLARNLAASPVVLSDRQVEQAVLLAGPQTVVQAINLVCQLAALNRLTEAANLPFESSGE